MPCTRSARCNLSLFVEARDVCNSICDVRHVSTRRRNCSSRTPGRFQSCGPGSTSTDIIEASTKAYVDGLNKLARPPAATA